MPEATAAGRRIGLLMVVAGALGLLAAMVLTIDRFRLLEDPGTQLACNLSPFIACGPVMQSRAGALLGFPHPLLGIVGFSVVLTTGDGGGLMALADLALYAAILANIGPVGLAVTTNLSFNFLRKPGATGLVGEARLLKLGRRLAVGEVLITAPGSDDLVCHATGTYAIPPER